jgi:hypothetical protein
MNLTKQDSGRIACASLSLSLILLALLPGRSTATRQNVSQQEGREEAECRLLSLLDNSVQQRFKDIDKGFGYRRIITAGDTPHRFKPENPKELKAVDELRRARMEVFLYVAGRSVLGKVPPDTDPKTYSRMRIKGPASITPTDDYNDTGDLPRPDQLWDQARAAMLAFHLSGDTHKFTIGKWKFSARPVFASEQSCVDCHNTRVTHRYLPSPGGALQEVNSNALRIGDPLGVVLYAYESHAK